MDEGVDGQAVEGAKPRRRTVAKAVVAPRVRKRKNGVRIGDEAFERLSIHALKSGKSNAVLMEELIGTHLKRYVVQDWGARLTEGVSAIQVGEVNLSASTLPTGEAGTSLDDANDPPPPGAGEGDVAQHALPARERKTRRAS